MPPNFNSSVFINCPFDEEFAPILRAIVFVVIYLGFAPRLATERSDAGENRLVKIMELIEGSRYSIHDLSRCQAQRKGEIFRLNMPFELGIDFGCRQYFGRGREEKRFLILEEKPYRFQAALSDISGCDIEIHGRDYFKAMTRVRAWLCQVAGCTAPGPTGLLGEYTTFQGWDYETRLQNGFSEADIKLLPTFDRMQSMRNWIAVGKPASIDRRGPGDVSNL